MIFRATADEPAREVARPTKNSNGFLVRATLWKQALQLSAFRASESAHEIDDQADQQNQAEPAPADGRAAKVEPAAAKQEKQNHHK